MISIAHISKTNESQFFNVPRIACSMGPGAWATVISSLAWFALSIEMKLNSALTHIKLSLAVMVIFE